MSYVKSYVNNAISLFLTRLFFLGKMASSAVFQLIFLYAAELFPTLIRNTALGFSNTASGLGSIGAPFVIGLGGIIPLIIMGGLAIIGGLSGIFLPETLGLPLPSTLEEVIL